MHPAGQDRALAPGDARGHHHALGRSRRAVIERGVGQLHPGKTRDLGLELEQDLQRALRDFRLIGRVAGQEFRALDQVVHRRRHVVAIGPGAAEEGTVPGRLVLTGIGGEAAFHLLLAAHIGQVHRPRQAGAGRRVGEQGVNVRRADH